MLTLIICCVYLARFLKHITTLVWGYFCLGVLVTALKDLADRLLRAAGFARLPNNIRAPARRNRRLPNRVKATKKETVTTKTEYILQF